jgi:uncharacterized membrane protein required for colicin V production
MNGFDFLIFGFIIFGSLLGFFQGVLRQVISLVSIYIAIVIALFLYRPFGSALGLIAPGMGVNARETLAFAIILVLINTFVTFNARDLTIDPKPAKEGIEAELEQSLVGRLSRRFILAPANHLGGMVFGFISSCVWVSLIIIMIRFVMQVPWPGYDGIRMLIVTGLQTSALAQFAEWPIMLIRNSVVWLPGGLPPLFQGEL